MKRILFLSVISLLSLFANIANAADWQTFNVNTPGTLEDLMTDWAATAPSSAYNNLQVKINGALNTADLRYLASGSGSVINKIKELDLRNVTVINSESQYYARITISTSDVSFYAFYCYTSDENYSRSHSGTWLGTIQSAEYFYGNCFAGVFTKFSSLETIYLPSYMTEIGAAAFFKCPVKTVHMSDKIIEVRPCAFAKSKIENISFPSTLKYIDAEAFAESSLKSISGTQNVEGIGAGAFYATSLQSINIPKALSIGESAFAKSNLSQIQLPNGLKEISPYLFDNCTQLSNISFPQSVDSVGLFALRNTPWVNNHHGDGGIIYVNNWAYSFAPSVPQTNYSVKQGTTNICEAFYANANGEYNGYISRYESPEQSSPYNITFPSSLTKIGNDAFAGATQIRNVNLGVPKHVGDRAFAYCPDINIAEFPATLRSIGYRAFYNGQTSITYRCKSALSNSSSSCFGDIKNVFIGHEVDTIPQFAFTEQNYLETLEFETRPNDSPLYIANNALNSHNHTSTRPICPDLHVINFPKRISYLGDYCFDGIARKCIFEPQIDLSGIESIGNYAFYACATAFPSNTIILHKGLKQLGHGAFGGIPTLTHVILESDSLAKAPVPFANAPESEAGDYVLYNYAPSSNILSATIKANVKILPAEIFSLCENIRHLEFEPRPHENYVPLTIKHSIVGDLNKFDMGVSLIDSIVLPYGTENICLNMFESTMKYIELPATLKTIQYGSSFFTHGETRYNNDIRIVCHAPTPPSGNLDNYFYDISKVTCYVPKQYYDIYAADTNWSRFNLKAFDSYIDENVMSVENIAGFLSHVGDATRLSIAGDVVVTYSTGKSIYVTDNSGHLYIYAESNSDVDFPNGTVLNGITGMPAEFVSGSLLMSVSNDINSYNTGTITPCDPAILLPSQVQTHQYAKIENARISLADGNHFAVVGNDSIQLADFFGVGLPYPPATLNITGIGGQEFGSRCFYPIEYEEINEPEEPEFQPGSKDNPLSTAIAATRAVSGDTVWVTGHIVMTLKTGGIAKYTDVADNFILSDYEDQLGPCHSFLVVELHPDIESSKALNIADNPSNLSRKVTIRGILGYHDKFEAITKVLDYFFIDDKVSIHSPEAPNQPLEIHDIQGRQLPAPIRGLNIINGRKVWVN